MKREILASAIGLACVSACGNDRRPAGAIDAGNGGQTDAPPTPPADAPADVPRQDASIDAPPAIPDPALRLRYDFEDGATVVTDTSGRGFNGTLSDVSAWTASGRNGRAVALTPIPGTPPAPRYVSIPSGVLAGVEDFTIAVWVNYKTISTATNNARIYDFGNGPIPGATRWMHMTVNHDGVFATSFGGSPQNELPLFSATPLPTGVWKHLALVGSGGRRELYIDGFPSDRNQGAVVLPKEMEPLADYSWLGRSRFIPPDPPLDATLDEFRVYSRVLTATEIADLAWPKNDYSNWRFDEGTGTATRDSSDRAITTTLMNGAAWTTGRLGSAVNLAGGPASPNGPHVAFSTSPLARCTTEVTFAVWVKVRALVTWARVFDLGSPGQVNPERFIFLTLQDDQGPADPTKPDGPRIQGMRFAMVSPNGAVDVMTATPPVPGNDTWHHVAVTVNEGKRVTMYVDGAIVKEQTHATGVLPSDFANTTNNWLGKSAFVASDGYLNGSLDDLRISCRAYTAGEIKALAFPVPPT